MKPKRKAKPKAKKRKLIQRIDTGSPHIQELMRAAEAKKLPTIKQDIMRRVEARAGARYADVAHVVTAWRDGIFSHAEAMYRIDDIVNGRPT